MMEFLSSGMGYGNPRQDTMRTTPAKAQNAPAITAGRMPVTPRGSVITRTGDGAKGVAADGLIYGRMSLGFVASLVVLLSVAYMWTRNVQGGG